MSYHRLFEALCVLLVSVVSVSGADPAAKFRKTPDPEDSPAAHWTFDESPKKTVLQEASGKSELSVSLERDLPRCRGVHGKALTLSGRQQLRVNADAIFLSLPQVTFSAWTRPSELSGYREIFRQECPQRLLFSFQHNGTILSLGLNVGGYVECDAEIQPGKILDGQWHHCAASFDGRFMRVYLDGREIGSLERPGTITTQTGIPAFIGSSGGGGEFFQGDLDDLRVYRTALSPDQVNSLYRVGLNSLAQASEEIAGKLDTIFEPTDSFATTLAGCRENLHSQSVTLDRDLTGALLARLKSRYPVDYESFVTWTGAGVGEYLVAVGNEFQEPHARRLVELVNEYRPLTDGQRAQCSPQELAYWKDVGDLENALETLVARGDAVRFSPEWVRLMLAAGPRIQHRPAVSEAVAPYQTPTTPPTRSLTDQEARDVLRRDWLHQAGQDPSPQRVRDEIRWTGELARRIAGQHPGKVDFARQLAQLAQLKLEEDSRTNSDAELYYRVRELKRTLVLSNPVLDFDSILFVDMPFPRGSEWPHETRHRLGYMAVPGGRLLVLEGLSPAGTLRQLMPQNPLHGSFWRPDLSYDATKALVCFKPHNEKAFHLYEIHVDGSGLTQLTEGPYDDLDPVYLPDDEHILFSTTRGHTYVRCMPPTNAFVLARCRQDGSAIYLVSRNNEPDYLPSVMNDGRVLYTRWEYTDKPLWRAQALWTMNPDGTQVNTFWGNQSVWPDLLKDARSIPGSRRVMFTGSAHHNWFSGSVGMIDPSQGYNFPQGLTKVTADVPWPESGNGPVDPIESPRYHASGDYTAYYSPCPLGEHDFLVSANRNGKFVLYLMDTDGNRELIHEGVHHVLHALPLRPRTKPPVIPDRVNWPDADQRFEPEDGVIYSTDVYDGAPPPLHGKARFLRVLNIDPKTYTYWHKRPYISTGPVVSMVQSEGVKRVLGTVPIEADGSVAFRAPAGKALHFQLLDARYRALQTMRSFTGVMPGESRGCQGCHESHSRAPQQQTQQTLALGKPPRHITPPPWDDDTVSYDRYVQPVLDKYCGECHQGQGEARDVLDLTRRPGYLMFDEPYVTLTGKPTWGKPYEKPQDPVPGWGIANTLMVESYGTTDPQAYVTPAPMSALSYKSPLIDLASSGDHYDVQVDPVSLRRLTVWVDTMCPYRGEDEVRRIPDPVFQGVDWLSVRPRIRSAPTIVRPGPVDVVPAE